MGHRDAVHTLAFMPEGKLQFVFQQVFLGGRREETKGLVKLHTDQIPSSGINPEPWSFQIPKIAKDPPPSFFCQVDATFLKMTLFAFDLHSFRNHCANDVIFSDLLSLTASANINNAYERFSANKREITLVTS